VPLIWTTEVTLKIFGRSAAGRRLLMPRALGLRMSSVQSYRSAGGNWVRRGYLALTAWFKGWGLAVFRRRPRCVRTIIHEKIGSKQSSASRSSDRIDTIDIVPLGSTLPEPHRRPTGDASGTSRDLSVSSRFRIAPSGDKRKAGGLTPGYAAPGSGYPWKRPDVQGAS
jgi:hypothetical protein